MTPSENFNELIFFLQASQRRLVEIAEQHNKDQEKIKNLELELTEIKEGRKKPPSDPSSSSP